MRASYFSGLIIVVARSESFIFLYCFQVTPCIAYFLSLIVTQLQQGPLKSTKLVVLFVKFHIIMDCIGLKGLKEALKYIMI
jgi:hypothetical protein